MKVFILSLIMFSFSLCSFAEDQLSEIIDNVSAQYIDIPGLSVFYEREIMTRTMVLMGDDTSMDMASGTIHFKPPHFLKIDQKIPNPELVTTDGDTLWWYIPQKKSVYQYPYEKLGHELTLLSDIFQGLRKVEESFAVEMEKHDEENEHRIRLTPQLASQQVDHIILQIEKNSSLIRMIEIHNLVGGITRFNLAKSIEEKVFEDIFFKFTPPEGTKIIEEN